MQKHGPWVHALQLIKALQVKARSLITQWRVGELQKREIGHCDVAKKNDRLKVIYDIVFRACVTTQHCYLYYELENP